MSWIPQDTNWFTSSERGRWVSVTEGFSGALTIGLGFMMIVFFGLMTTGLGQPSQGQADVEEHVLALIESVSALGIGLFYMIITVLFLVFWYIASFRPDVPGTAVVDLGDMQKWFWTVPFGILFGGLFVFGMQQGLGSFFAFESITVFGVDIEPIILFLAPVIAIPIVEEFFFGGVLTPTLAEFFGVVPAAIMVGLIWNLWHLGTYTQQTEILLFLFAFRFLGTFIILWTESLLPMIVAHIVINAAGTLLVI